MPTTEPPNPTPTPTPPPEPLPPNPPEPPMGGSSSPLLDGKSGGEAAFI